LPIIISATAVRPAKASQPSLRGALREHRHPDRRGAIGRERSRDVPGRRRSLLEVQDPGRSDTGSLCAESVRVHDFYNLRRRWHKQARPNAAHIALAKLEAEHGGNVLTVTQNIDALHEAAGTRRLIHMHGELACALCAACGTSAPWKEDLSTETLCAACGEAALRPDVVWFGEMPREMERIYDALAACDLFISIGTSGTVHPATGFVLEARAAGAHTVELNLEPSDGADLFRERIEGPATEIVPAYVDRLLGT